MSNERETPSDDEGGDAAADAGDGQTGPADEAETVIETIEVGGDRTGDASGETADSVTGDAADESTDADDDDGISADDDDAEPAGSDEAIELKQRAQRLDQREMGLDSRAEALDDREERLDDREQELVEQRETLAQKRAELDEREDAVADREAELDERETTIEQREQELEEYATELNQRDRTLREYVGDQVGDSVEEVVSIALDEHVASTPAGRFGPTGGLVLGLVGLALVVGGVANALATEAGAFSAVLGSTTGNVVLSAALITVGLAGNLAVAADRV